MTALHTLAQYRPKSAEFGGVQKQADLSSPGVSKMIIMAKWDTRILFKKLDPI